MTRTLIICAALFLALPFAAIAEDGLMVSRATFCTGITDREPADSPEVIMAGEQTAYFFTEILNGSGQSVTHRWTYNDVPIADVTLRIGSDRWRTWSTKQVWHLTPGTLKVEVLDSSGQQLAEREIIIQ